MRHGFSSSTVVLVGRLVLVTVAAGASAVGFVVWHHDARSVAVGQASPARYVCPMHPQVVSTSPGDCPICRMALVRKPNAGSGEIEAAPAEVAGTGHAGPATVTLPAEKALNGWDALSLTKRFESALEMRAPAAADSGRTGVALFHLDESELIRPGERGLFSPSSGPRGGEPQGLEVHILSGSCDRVDGARLGRAESSREGTGTLPGCPFERWDESTVLVRFEVGPGAKLVANETGLLKLATRLREGLVVREGAIIDSPGGPYVLVAEADRRTFTKRPVEIGTRLYGYAAVVSGLREGERVAAAHTFVLDVQRRGQRTAP